MNTSGRLLYASSRLCRNSRRISSTAPLDLAPPIAIAPNPIVYHFLPRPLPYARGLLLQETIVAHRLAARKQLLSTSVPLGEREKLERIAKTDVLLLLEHTPVYTAGRRETDPIRAEEERKRLGSLGADYVGTMRGGQTTYHGPGQLVGYPIIDLAAAQLSTRCYVNSLELYLASIVSSLGIPVVTPSPHTGVFTSPNHKIGSIGIHIRHRITLHGFALNVEASVLDWFSHIVACGLDDVFMTSVETELEKLDRRRIVKVEDLVAKSVDLFGERFGRRMEVLGTGEEHTVLRELIEEGVQGRLPRLESK